MKRISKQFETDLKAFISEYAGLNIFNIEDCELIVYGGFVRDFVHEETPKDLDILCLNNSAQKLSNILLSFGWKPDDENENFEGSGGSKFLTKRLINKKNPSKKIEIILYKGLSELADSFTLQLLKFAAQVDISTSGLICTNGGVFEVVKNASKDITTKQFRVRTTAEMYHADRIQERIEKLKSKGYVQIEDNLEDPKIRLEDVAITFPQ